MTEDYTMSEESIEKDDYVLVSSEIAKNANPDDIHDLLYDFCKKMSLLLRQNNW